MLTQRQNTLLQVAHKDIIVRVFGATYRTANQLVSKGYGKVTSNPGTGYKGPRITNSCPYGAYYVAPGYTFNQTTKAFEPEDVKTSAETQAS
jgi:hypothetical protein